MSIDLSFSRLVPTSDGGSRFDTVTIPFTRQNFAPPAQPFSVSPLSQASQCGFLVSVRRRHIDGAEATAEHVCRRMAGSRSAAL